MTSCARTRGLFITKWNIELSFHHKSRLGNVQAISLWNDFTLRAVSRQFRKYWTLSDRLSVVIKSAFVPIRPSRFKSGTCSSTARRRKGKILSLNFFSLFWNLFLSNRFKFRDRWELISRHGSMQVCFPLRRIRAPTELFRPFFQE